MFQLNLWGSRLSTWVQSLTPGRGWGTEECTCPSCWQSKFRTEGLWGLAWGAMELVISRTEKDPWAWGKVGTPYVFTPGIF